MKRLFVGIFFLLFCHAAFAEKLSGTIEGNLGWPGEELPKMKICAEDVNNKKVECMNLSSTDYAKLKYSWKLPVGTYYIFSQLLQAEGQVTATYRAYYSTFVTCGATVKCTSHKPIPVSVRDGKTLSHIDPVDWYSAK